MKQLSMDRICEQIVFMLWIDIACTLDIHYLFFVTFGNDSASDCPGSATVPVANCNEEQSYAHPKADMKFSDFVGYMKRQCSTDDTAGEQEKSVLYLKDWHCQRHVSCR